jgi:VIT1/CCC1 family predicted Fe2+/Mn2+ transporter
MNNQRKKILLAFQQAEITESLVYKRLATIQKDSHNQEILQAIGADEARHADILSKHTGVTCTPNKFRVFLFVWVARILGITFALKRMENGESKAQCSYADFKDEFPDIAQIIKEEEAHEQALISMLNEEKLGYMSSVVLGLNDALVELTGALAGFTLALQDAKIVALVGSITGISAALSMAASEYMSTRMGDEDKHPFKSSIYTGIAYLITVIILIVPFLCFNNIFVSLAATLLAAVCIIAAFNYYYSVVKNESFKSHFLPMTGLSLGVAVISFGIGYLLKTFTGIEI